MMKQLFLIPFLLIIILTNNFGQEGYTIELETMSLSSAPRVHSFSYGIDNNGKWLIIGGRIDGLHQRQPFAAFLESENNKQAFLIDVNSNQSWSVDLSTLPTPIFEQLQSTNQQYKQRGNTLYIIGGYGFSSSTNDHITYPYITAIDIEGLSNAMINETDITPYFRQIQDINIAVTGGQLEMSNDTFYLAGGHFFEGSYNPMGPDHGPGFVQIYTEEVRFFKIDDDGTNLSISNFNAWSNTDHFHRRDYNMMPQIFPDGTKGMTMFSGVFRKDIDLPYLNTIDIKNNNYSVNNDFNQRLNNYHCAKLPIYDASNNRMDNIFFGGIAQFYFDDNNNLIEDNDVPFVKTIGKVSRMTDGTMSEVKIGELPLLLGAGAEFIPLPNNNYYDDEGILLLENIPDGKHLVGYIYGGIESSQANIFFINDGTQSEASNIVFEVYINKTTTSLNEISVTTEKVWNIKVFPNPADSLVNIHFYNPTKNDISINIYDAEGKLLGNLYEKHLKDGQVEIQADLSVLSKGIYFVEITNGTDSIMDKIIIK